MLVSHAQILLPLNDAELEETNNYCTSHTLQSVTCLSDGPPQLRIPGVHYQALRRCVHRISRSLQLRFRLGASAPTSPWFPSFLGCGSSNSAVRMMAAVNAAFRTSLRSLCLVRMSSIRFLPRPLKLCDTPPGCAKNVFTRARLNQLCITGNITIACSFFLASVFISSLRFSPICCLLYMTGLTNCLPGGAK